MLSDEQKANVRKWIEALRSGEYEQGKEALCKNGKYCCLGVACDLYQRIGPGDLLLDGTRDTILRFDGEPGVLPTKVKYWLGLSDDQGIYAYSGPGPMFLTELNDNGTPFDGIANVIERAMDSPDSPLFVTG